MLRPEIDRHAPWWTYVGSVSGGAIGYIVGNFPGMVRMVSSAPADNMAHSDMV